MSTIAGVDYSTKAVHGAIVADKALTFVKRYDLGADPLPWIDQLLELLKTRGVEAIYMEAPFFIPARIDKEGKLRQGSNVNTLKLHEVANQIATVAKLKGLEVVKVAPATWQSQLLTGVPGSTTKERSVWFAQHVWGIDVARDDNKADAICLATYGEALARFKGVIPPAIEVR